MYEMIHTDGDRLKEDYIYGCELTELGFPRLPRCEELVDGNLKSVPLHLASKERHPEKALCHMFLDDSRFESLWNQPHKQIDMLKRYKFVTAPDFSCWGSMPLPLQMYNKYRIHAMTWYLMMNDVNVIPTVTWNNISSYNWVFDGMPKDSVVAIASNGVMSQHESFIRGFNKMCDVLEPRQIVWIGREIEVDSKCDIIFFESYGQQMNKRMGR